MVPAKKGISLNILLEEDSQMLGEVEVVAYGVPTTFIVFCCTPSEEKASLLYPLRGTDKNKNNKIATGNNRHNF